jgi:predicted dehydrogenase/threonine dehydrogenase-like Zn-dependent dehydrogenase
MKQVIQSRRTGKLSVKDVPDAQVHSGHLLVRTHASLISAGTERMVVDFAKKSLARKAQARPDLVKKVIDKAKKEGLRSTFQTVMARLDEPLPLGYSAAGEVLEVGAGLEGEFRVGDRVAMAGAGVANHAELNSVPRNLVAPIPTSVPYDEACYGTVGAIAMHAARNTGAGLGDIVAIIGCGLVGQLAARFLTLAGARVIALDYAEDRLKLAKSLGAELAIKPNEGALEAVLGMSGGRGADAVLNAAATDKSEPFELAADLARDRARIVMVGLTGTTFPYQTFMQKELNLIVSRSYGPGRYDSDFEQRGVKYPEGWVRWTEKENLAEAVRLMRHDLMPRLDVSAMTTHHFSLSDAESAYALVTGGKERHLGVVLTYDGEPQKDHVPNIKVRKGSGKGSAVVGMIGAGNFAKAVLVPALKNNADVRLKTLVTQRGSSAEHGADTGGFEVAATEQQAVLADDEINAVVIATRHDSHASLSAAALAAGKSVFVEKPLALTRDELSNVVNVLNDSAGLLHVGFNRRFAPQIATLCDHFKGTAAPRMISLRVNGGNIDKDHWTQSVDEGGGRVLGEMCHFVDLARHLADSPITHVQAAAATAEAGTGDDVSAHVQFADGSLATIIYTAQGDTALAKERVEVFSGGKAAVLDDFQALTLISSGKTQTSSAAQDKGHGNQIGAFVDAIVKGGEAPIPAEQIVEVTEATIAVLESLRTGQRIEV